MTQIAEAGEFMPAQFELDAPLVFDSRHLSHPVEVPTRFRTDLASVPRVPLAYWLAGGLANRPAVVHDWLCEKLYSVRRITWRQAADILREAMEAEGVAPWRRWLIHKAVLVHGRYLDLGKCR